LKIPIFVMYHNQKEWSELCLEYLQKNTNKNLYELILINNGSSINLNTNIKYKKVDFKEPVGVSFAYNEAIEKYAKNSKYFIILHNDVLVTPKWLKKMLKCANNIDRDFSAIFPRTNYATSDTPSKHDEEIKEIFCKNKIGNKKLILKENIYDNLSNTYNDGIEGYCDNTTGNFQSETGRYCVSDELCCFCTLFNSENFFNNNMFDTDFLNVGGEAKLLHYLSVTKYNIYPIHLLEVFVHHNGNTTSDMLGHDFKAEEQESESILKKKIQEIEKKEILKKKQNTFFLKDKSNMLVVRSIGIGDIIISLFCLSFLKKIKPKIHITYATHLDFMNFVSNFDCVNKVIPFSETDFSKQLYKDKFDIIFDWSNENLEKKTQSKHLHRFDLILSLLNKNLGDKSWFNGIKKDSLTIPKYCLKKNKEIPNRNNNLPLIAISPSGTTPIRSMPDELLRNIIKIESTNKQIIILGKEKIDIESEYMYNVINLSGKTKLEEIPEIISLCDYVYTTDSGVLHIAGILEIPTRSFFGSIDSKLRTGLYKENEKNKIYCKKELPCVPCNDVGCSEIYCMKYTKEEVEKIIND